MYVCDLLVCLFNSLFGGSGDDDGDGGVVVVCIVVSVSVVVSVVCLFARLFVCCAVVRELRLSLQPCVKQETWYGNN